MTSALSTVQQITVTIDFDLAGFVKGEAARTACLSVQDYIISVLAQERLRRGDELLKRKQLANQTGDSTSRDMI